ncbi:GNAT family N-acetyltransferase [Ideonella sp. DXS22W]|uniref:GNAT family N-acetyltransferase n=1 Tax=Pseudaquabacterium inlustre TaxID=2984192 RepID=A0ABU9CF23_9BURK
MKTLRAAFGTLEPLLASHAAEMFAVLSDPAIYEFENAPPASVDALHARYVRQQRRGPDDGSEVWLNWVIRLSAGADAGRLAGYVQATVLPDGHALVAYELHSRHWRQGIGSAAVRAMLAELAQSHGVQRFVAVLKRRNHRSAGLLHKLGFEPADAALDKRFRDAADERVMTRLAAGHLG